MSDKFASLTMPGSFRRAKTKLIGPSKMKEDPLEVARADLAEFDSMLLALGSCVQTVRSSVDMLSAAPNSLIDSLQRFYSQGAPNSSLAVGRFCAQLSAFAMQIRSGEGHLEAVQQLLQEMSRQNAAAREAFGTRDAAWETYSHYEGKVENLQEQMSRSTTSPRLAEKLNRNVQKRRDSEVSFQAAMATAGGAVSEVLSGKWRRTGEVLSRLCHYYVAVFDTADGLARELGVAAEQLTAPATIEAVSRRGQEQAVDAVQKGSAKNPRNSARASPSPWAGPHQAEASDWGGFGGFGDASAASTDYRGAGGGPWADGRQAPPGRPQAGQSGAGRARSHSPRSYAGDGAGSGGCGGSSNWPGGGCGGAQPPWSGNQHGANAGPWGPPPSAQQQQMQQRQPQMQPPQQHVPWATPTQQQQQQCPGPQAFTGGGSMPVSGPWGHMPQAAPPSGSARSVPAATWPGRTPWA